MQRRTNSYGSVAHGPHTAWPPPTGTHSPPPLPPPPGTLHEPFYAGPRAKQYPFTLDPFQETSIACLVGGRGSAGAERGYAQNARNRGMEWG